MDDETTRQLDALFDPFARSSEPGGAVAISNKGAPAYRRAFGMASLETCIANQVSTPMPVGSIAKQFTAAAILLLQADGILSTADTLQKWLPELSEDHQRVTIDQLLRHQAGVQCYLDHWMFNGYETLPAGVPWAIQTRQQALNFAPGTCSAYSNGGYLLLSKIIERASAMPLPHFFAARLFGPAGMHASQIATWRDAGPGVAAPYMKDAKSGAWHLAQRLTEEASGDGGLISTADDLLRWARYLREADGPVNLQALLAPHADRADGPSDYRYGVISQTWRGVELIQHTGGMPGANSVLIIVPEHGIDVAIQFNRPAPAMQYAFKALEVLLGDRLEAAAEAPQTEPYKDLLGTYWSGESRFLFTLSDLDGQLGLSFFGDRPFPLDTWHGDDCALPFWADAGASQIRFRRGSMSGALDYFDGKSWFEAERIELAGGDAAEMIRQVPELFRSDEADAELELELDGAQPSVHVYGCTGHSRYEAEWLTEDLLRFWPPLFPAGKLAELVRVDGVVRSLIVSTPRSRAIEFASITEEQSRRRT